MPVRVPDSTVSHPALLDAVHVQVGRFVVTLTLPAPSFAVVFSLVGEIPYVQTGGGGVGGDGGGGGGGGGCGLLACVTDDRRPAMVIVPVRCAPSFNRTANVTVPFPLPVSGEVSAIQFTSAAAVHAHSVEVVIVALP